MTIADISPPVGLNPKTKFFEEVDDTCINIDGCIELARTIDTPAAQAVWRAFRRQHALIRLNNPSLAPEKQREEAFFKALHELGFKTPMILIKGTME